MNKLDVLINEAAESQREVAAAQRVLKDYKKKNKEVRSRLPSEVFEKHGIGKESVQKLSTSDLLAHVHWLEENNTIRQTWVKNLEEELWSLKFNVRKECLKIKKSLIRKISPLIKDVYNDGVTQIVLKEIHDKSYFTDNEVFSQFKHLLDQTSWDDFFTGKVHVKNGLPLYLKICRLESAWNEALDEESLLVVLSTKEEHETERNPWQALFHVFPIPQKGDENYDEEMKKSMEELKDAFTQIYNIFS